jgi:hypothetical protein
MKIIKQLSATRENNKFKVAFSFIIIVAERYPSFQCQPFIYPKKYDMPESENNVPSISSEENVGK